MTRADPMAETPAARRMLDAQMSEKALFESVRDHLNAFGWLWYHTRDSRGSSAGFPDIVATRYWALLFIELKREKAFPTDMQKLWLDSLDGAGGEDGTPYGAKVYVWRPRDLSSGEVERVLRSL